MIHTDVAVMNVSSIDGARYFATFIDEVSCQVSPFRIKSTCEAPELLKGQVTWVERPSGCMVKSSVSESRREYTEGSMILSRKVFGLNLPHFTSSEEKKEQADELHKNRMSFRRGWFKLQHLKVSGGVSVGCLRCTKSGGSSRVHKDAWKAVFFHEADVRHSKTYG